MPQKIQVLRTTVKNTRPTAGTRSVGEIYVSFPDLQFGAIDVSLAPKDLIGVRFFSPFTNYGIGDYVVQAGDLYRAKNAIVSAAFNVADWDKVANTADLSGKQDFIPLGTTLQYYRGDKTWAALDKAAVGLGNVDNTSDANKPVSTAQLTALNAKEDKANKAVANGYASLDATAKVPAAQLPSYVDDVLEFANLAAFPATGVAGVMYLALDTGKIYRWTGTVYVEISPSPGSTDAVPEGSVNLYHTTARAAAAAPVQSVSGKTGVVVLTKTDVGLNNVDNTSDLGKPISTATQAALNLKENLIAAGTVSQYWKGDKSWALLDKAAVGLGNVDNTSDGNKPVSSAQQAALNLKANTASPTFTGKATTQAPSAPGAGFSLPHGTPPTTPVNGDMWTTTAGLFACINGITLGFGSGISDAPSDGKPYVRYNAGWVESSIDVGTF